jgi:chromosome partitioning protein
MFKNVQSLMTNLRKMQGIILIDAPGNLTQQGLIPIFANSDYIICPFQYEVTSINATATFISFIYKIRDPVVKKCGTTILGG